MTPKDSSQRNPSGASSNLVKWTGSNIPCLGIKYGDMLTEAVHKIACRVCEIAGDLDLSDLDLGCLLSKPNVKPEDKNVKLVLELLLENQCSLKELIDTISQGSEEAVLKVNMRCLKKYDAFQNEIEQNNQAMLQSIVDEVCQHQSDIALLEQKTQDLQSQIDSLDLIPEPPAEKVISTCVAIQKPISQSVILLAQEHCDLKSVVGTPEEIQASMAQQCSGLNAEYADIVGWNSTPANQAQSFQNLWIAFCELQKRVKAMEQTCCAPSCDRIKLGFAVDFNFQDREATLVFDSGSGTAIPTGFTDCGTVLAITDERGYTKQYSNLNITQGVESIVSLTGLSTGKLVFNFKTKFCLKDANGQTLMVCQDCVEQSADYFDSSCCIVTNTGTKPITIVIDTCSAGLAPNS